MISITIKIEQMSSLDHNTMKLSYAGMKCKERIQH